MATILFAKSTRNTALKSKLCAGTNCRSYAKIHTHKTYLQWQVMMQQLLLHGNTLPAKDDGYGRASMRVKTKTRACELFDPSSARKSGVRPGASREHIFLDGRACGHLVI